jgi:hypothetical protein
MVLNVLNSFALKFFNKPKACIALVLVVVVVVVSDPESKCGGGNARARRMARSEGVRGTLG